MFKKFLTKNISVSLFIFFISISGIARATSTAATKSTDHVGLIGDNISGAGKLIQNINTNIFGNLVTLLSSVAFALFLFGLVRFIYDRSSGDDTRLQKDKEAMMWGLVALFILISVWGIIKMFQGFLGIGDSGDINLPKICAAGSCDSKSDPASNANKGGIKDQVFKDPKDTTKKLDVVSNIDSSYDIEKIRAWQNNLKEDMGSPNGTNEIAQLQLFLKDHGYANYLGNTGPNKDGVDGIYGPKTTLAVKAFQKANALAQDGIVGYGTKAVILYRHMGAKPDRDLYSVDFWPALMTNGKSTDANSDGSVSDLQSFLRDQGYDLGTSGTHGIDGIYGGKTTQALLNFQAKFFLKEDNLVGPSTKAVIMFVENRNK